MSSRKKSLVCKTVERCSSSGCFSVYVGAEKKRFEVRAESANHPLFRRLLDDAEREYGYVAQGPLQLPCHVTDFLHVLCHMDQHHHSGIKEEQRVLRSAKTLPASFGRKKM